VGRQADETELTRADGEGSAVRLYRESAADPPRIRKEPLVANAIDWPIAGDILFIPRGIGLSGSP
jgi:hypothetical protein